LRHDIHIAGHAFQLRPVVESDAAFIVGLRGHARNALNHGADTQEEQLRWLSAYFERSDDFYFVVESIAGAEREGVIGLYDIQDGAAQWGRWVLRAASNAAVESALLIYRCAFSRLSLQRVWCRTLATNAAVVAFHDSCGLERAPDPVSMDHDGKRRSAVEHALNRSDWPQVMQRLDAMAARFARTRRNSRMPVAPR
jgi:RimJ/RimL family protein N-acetyltransferase